MQFKRPRKPRLAQDGVPAGADLWYPTMRPPPVPRPVPERKNPSRAKSNRRKYGKKSDINLNRIPVDFHQFAPRRRLTLAHELGDQRLGLAEIDGAQHHRQ